MDAQCSNGSKKHRQSKLQLISIMSVPPLKVTEPRKVCKVLVNNDTDTKTTIQGCYQIVLYYEKKNEDEEHSWSLAGWIVESLARALLEYPLLAGRLQRREVGDHIGLEIVSNDSGVRLLEAYYQMGLSEFLEFNEREHLEDELVPWEEIDAQCPYFSPLSYVQVTCFECGGYSIGISCSLLLAEVMVVENFLNKWAQIHNMLHQQNQDTNEIPVFCHPRIENPESPPSPYTITNTPTKHGIQTMIFKINYGDANFNKGLWRQLAMLCVEKAEQKLDKEIMSSDFNLVVKESSENIMVETLLKKNGYNVVKGLDLKNQIRGATWNDFGVNEVAFCDGNKPVHVSCWIGSVADGCVMAIPCPQRNACVVIVVSPPS